MTEIVLGIFLLTVIVLVLGDHGDVRPVDPVALAPGRADGERVERVRRKDRGQAADGVE
jgi:hypothetical protein